MARKKDNPLVGNLQSKCDFCDSKVVWRNDKFAVCTKHYDEHIYPHVVVNKATIAFQKKLREVDEWITKHPEFKTKREACREALKARGKIHLLPESVR